MYLFRVFFFGFFFFNPLMCNIILTFHQQSALTENALLAFVRCQEEREGNEIQDTRSHLENVIRHTARYYSFYIFFSFFFSFNF